MVVERRYGGHGELEDRDMVVGGTTRGLRTWGGHVGTAGEGWGHGGDTVEEGGGQIWNAGKVEDTLGGERVGQGTFGGVRGGPGVTTDPLVPRSDAVVSQVLDELGLNLTDELASECGGGILGG